MAGVAPPNWSQGCEHYKRYCKLLAPCCNTVYTCRVCHDEKEDHTLDRRSVRNLVCSVCSTVQTLRYKCRSCGVNFGMVGIGLYACLTCRLFDEDDKGQFHCQVCGLCRVGGLENYFHCSTCNLCLAVRLRNNHKCLKDASRNNCPVCLEDLHTSRNTVHVPPCGHLLHESCFESLGKSGRKSCPICQAAF